MLSIRNAVVEDVSLLRTLIYELAEFERGADSVVITDEDLRRDGFGVNPKFRALIAEWEGQPVGYALFFGFYSSWDGPGILLEDMFVRPLFRGRGIGRDLLRHLAHIAKQENCFAIRWEVLDWNEPAIAFYRSLGGEFLDEWRAVILKGESLESLGDELSPSSKL